jgi:transposase InsO family protein
MREISVVEQRYEAVRAVIADGETVTDVAARFGVSRKTMHVWLARYEEGGLDGLADRSHRPRSCPHQMSAAAEVALVDLRMGHPSWGPRRLSFELAKGDVVVTESAAYRALVRLNLIDPAGRRPRDRKWKRWERGTPMELWQMDVVGGFVLADGTKAKVLSGVDDHSRFCVSAHVMTRESTQRVCAGLRKSLETFGAPEQILTDNGKVFTGRFNVPPVESLFDRICRENGIKHLLTKPRSPTTTGKIERFHRAIRTEFRTDRVFASLEAAQAELDAWVVEYNTERPHQAMEMATPSQRFYRAEAAPVATLRPTGQHGGRPAADRGDGIWVARRASAVGVVCVSWQQVCLGAAAAGRTIDVWVTEEVMQFYDGDELLRTSIRENKGKVRVKRAQVPNAHSKVQTGATDQAK